MEKIHTDANLVSLQTLCYRSFLRWRFGVFTLVNCCGVFNKVNTYFIRKSLISQMVFYSVGILTFLSIGFLVIDRMQRSHGKVIFHEMTAG